MRNPNYISHLFSGQAVFSGTNTFALKTHPHCPQILTMPTAKYTSFIKGQELQVSNRCAAIADCSYFGSTITAYALNISFTFDNFILN